MVIVGVVGAGTMGAGIAQVAAQNGHQVVLVDTNQEMLNKAELGLGKVLARLVEKGTISADGSTAGPNLFPMHIGGGCGCNKKQKKNSKSSKNRKMKSKNKKTKKVSKK